MNAVIELEGITKDYGSFRALDDVSFVVETGIMTLVAQRLEEMGFDLVATQGTVKALQRAGVHARSVKKIHEGRPNVLDLIKSGEVQLVINTPTGRLPRADEIQIRRPARH